jgi:hypothetical protein
MGETIWVDCPIIHLLSLLGFGREIHSFLLRYLEKAILTLLKQHPMVIIHPLIIHLHDTIRILDHQILDTLSIHQIILPTMLDIIMVIILGTTLSEVLMYHHPTDGLTLYRVWVEVTFPHKHPWGLRIFLLSRISMTMMYYVAGAVQQILIVETDRIVSL